MLASKIEDFPKLWPSKRPSKFHRFLHRFFVDFGPVLASNMGPSWGPRRLKIHKNNWDAPGRCPPKAVLNTTLLLDTVLGTFRLGFWGIRARFSKIFERLLEPPGHTLGMFSAALAGGATPPQTPPLLTWFSLFLVRSSANFAKKIQELAEDKAENPRTCRGQSREQNPYERLQENSNLKALFF